MAIQQEYLSARAANERRYAQAMSIYDEIIKRYQPGGTFGKAALGQLETQKVRDVGAETQQMISSGLYGTTTTAGLPQKWESEVGAPSRLRLEDIMMERLSQAQIGKAGFIERREDVYPNVGAMAGFAQQTAAARPSAPQKSLASFMSGFDVRNRGGGGTTSGAGQSPLQLRLATENRARAEAERERRAQTTTTVGAGTYPQATGGTTPTPEQPAGVPTSLAVGAQMSKILGIPTTYKQETKSGEQVMGIYKGSRRVGSYTMAQYAGLNK